MTMKLNISGSKWGKSGQIRPPFVGHIRPYVGPFRPHVLPLIGKKQPLVPNHQNQRGFTLIELMITLVVLGVLAAIAAPAMRDIVLNNRLATETNDMLVSLMFSRGEAIKRSTTVILCSTLDTSASPSVCDGGSDWATGWIIFADASPVNGVYDDGVDVVLRFGDGFPGTGNKINLSSGNTSFGYSRLGMLTASNMLFFICDNRGSNFARVVDVFSTGRARVNRDVAPAAIDCT